LKAETTKVDLWIKKRLLNEIIYRVVIWSIVSIMTYFILSHTVGFSVIGFFKSYMPKQIDLINRAFPLAFIFTLAATLFRDMAACEKSIWGEETLFGIVGIIVRKFCAEALLWSAALSYGSFFIILITLIQVLPSETSVNPVARGIVIYRIVLLLFVTIANLGCYYFIRREGKSFFLEATSSKRLNPLLYIVAILYAGGGLYIGT